MRLRTLGIVLVSGLIGTGAVACGNNDEGLSKSEFIAQANAICKKGDEAFNALFETDFPVTQNQLGKFFEKATPVVRDQIDALRALKPPADDKDTIKKILEHGDTTVKDFERAQTNAAFAAKVFGSEGGANNKKAEDGFVKYGVKKCGPDEDEGDGPGRLDSAKFSPEKRAYVERADAVCKAGLEKRRVIEQDVFAEFPPTLEKWAAGLPKLAAEVRAIAAGLEKLSPPAPDKGTIDALIDRWTAELGKVDEGARLAKAGNEAEFAKVMRPVFTGLEEVEGDFVKYGFQVCGPDDESN